MSYSALATSFSRTRTAERDDVWLSDGAPEHQSRIAAVSLACDSIFSGGGADTDPMSDASTKGWYARGTNSSSPPPNDTPNSPPPKSIWLPRGAVPITIRENRRSSGRRKPTNPGSTSYAYRCDDDRPSSPSSSYSYESSMPDPSSPEIRALNRPITRAYSGLTENHTAPVGNARFTVESSSTRSFRDTVGALAAASIAVSTASCTCSTSKTSENGSSLTAQFTTGDQNASPRGATHAARSAPLYRSRAYTSHMFRTSDCRRSARSKMFCDGRSSSSPPDTSCVANAVSEPRPGPDPSSTVAIRFVTNDPYSAIACSRCGSSKSNA